MRPDLPSIIIGVSGIAGTLTMGILGLYYTARARTSASRQVLYTKQIELAQRAFRALGRAKNYARLLEPDSEYQDEARADLGKLIKSIFALSNEAALLFPTEVYIALKKVSDAVGVVVEEYDEGRDIITAVDKLKSQDVKWTLMVRLLIGIDELSTQSLALHANQKALDRLQDFPADDFVSAARRDME